MSDAYVMVNACFNRPGCFLLLVKQGMRFADINALSTKRTFASRKVDYGVICPSLFDDLAGALRDTFPALSTDVGKKTFYNRPWRT
jgi:hypothetical protein